jgi:hypothetical protein
MVHCPTRIIDTTSGKVSDILQGFPAAIYKKVPTGSPVLFVFRFVSGTKAL